MLNQQYYFCHTVADISNFSTEKFEEDRPRNQQIGKCPLCFPILVAYALLYWSKITCAECHIFSDMPKINMHLNSISNANHEIQVALAFIHSYVCPMACMNNCFSFNAIYEIHI